MFPLACVVPCKRINTPILKYIMLGVRNARNGLLLLASLKYELIGVVAYLGMRGFTTSFPVDRKVI